MKTRSLLFGFMTIVIFSFSCKSSSQEYETRLDFFPSKRDNVTDEEYRKGKYILEQTYAAIKKDSLKITYADHLNIACAFAILKEPKETILYELVQAQEKNLESTATMFILGVKSPEVYNLTQNEYDSLKSKFLAIYEKSQMEKKEVDIAKYARDNDLNEGLVRLISSIGKEDQKHRTGDVDMELQIRIDEINMEKIDSLYSEYHTYIGRSLVGKEYESIMWAVIQHSTLEKHEEYLKVVQEAVESHELPETPFKMLIDRIYAKKHGYQIFGSQGGIPLGTASEIDEVKNKFGID